MDNKKISKAKAKLLLSNPALGSIASKVDFKINNDLQSFKYSDAMVEINNDFLNNSSMEELEFVLANSAMHGVMEYEQRKQNRSGWLWKLSCDYAINDILVQSSMQRPFEANYSKRFENMYVEEIYKQLQDDILRDDLEYESDDVDDMNRDLQNDKTEQSLDEELNYEDSVAQIKQNFDSLPVTMKDGFGRVFKISFKTKISWRDELKNVVDRFLRDDFTFMRPNKKFLHVGYYLPSATSEMFSLTIAIDSSASIDEGLLNEFASEINSLFLSVQNYKIELLVCDDRIRQHKTFFSGESFEVEIKGGMGTDFRPVFDYIDENITDTKLLLYFSDLDGIFPKSTPRFDTIWISSSDIEVTFGKVIKI